MDIEKISQFNPWWKGKELIEKDFDIMRLKERKYSWFPNIIDKIDIKPFSLHTLIGPRQTGKTTATKLLIKKLLNSRKAESLFYFNCEELADFKEVLDVLNSYLSFKEANDIKSSVIFLDEITSPKEWYKAIKSLLDKGALKNDVIVLTGSSSMMIKREIELFPGRRGYGKDFVLYPLSFREFLSIKNPVLYKKINPLGSLQNLQKLEKYVIYTNELNHELAEFIKSGGFPLSIGISDVERNTAKQIYLSWIKNALLKADRSDVIARQIIKAVVEKMPSAISWEGVSKEIEIKSPKTVSAYIETFHSMFAINILHNIDINSKKIKFGRNKKIHFIDPLLFEICENWCMLSIKNRESIIMESLMVSHLFRMFPENVYFWKNGMEIDALVHINEKIYGFEMKWSDNPDIKMSKLPSQIKNFAVFSKTKFRKNPLIIPLSVFLSAIDV